MARKALLEKEKRRKELVDRHFEKRQNLKKVIANPLTSDEERQNAVVALNKMPRDTSPIRIRNRCLYTGRSRGYLRKFKMSRLCFRELASSGHIPGVFKASW